MDKITSDINVEKIVKTIKDNFKTLKEGLDISVLTEEERIEMLQEIQELKKIALKLKTDSVKQNMNRIVVSKYYLK